MSHAVYNYVKMQVQMQSNQIRLTVSYYLNKPLLRVRKQTCTISLSVLPQQSFQQLSVTWIWTGKCSRTYQKALLPQGILVFTEQELGAEFF